MKKIFLNACALLLCASAFAAQGRALEGMEFGAANAPKGDEWNDPSRLSLNKLAPRAWYFSFKDVKSARKVLPEFSDYYLSLDGTWRFNWVASPEQRPKRFYEANYDASAWDEVTVPMSWNMYGVQKDGSLKYGVPIYVNQKVIFHHEVKVDDWKGGVMRKPAEHWTTAKYPNEVGSYRRTFTLPESWAGREVFMQFDGVDSFFYLWVNGTYIGFSKNSRNAARFDITPYVKPGNNVVAVEVYRSSDGSFLEAQDMFRLPGIFRSVSVYSTPKAYISNLEARPDLDGGYQNGSLLIKASVNNLSKSDLKKYHIEYSLYENKLYSDDNTLVPDVSATAELSKVAKGTEQTVEAALYVIKPKKWSAEAPHRYTLVAQLKDKKGHTVETVSTIVGFRKVEIKETAAKDDEFGLAGRYYYINGKTVKLKGVNRHESNPELGHAITVQQMEDEVMLMKRANINHVRNSHYPDHPMWYYLCNKYGIYLEDEANIESHEYQYGAASLSHAEPWRPAHVARVMEMAHSNVNHPSIVIWSLGNEAGPGHNFVACYDSLKAYDPTRPIQYERAEGDRSMIDMGSNQYPSVAWVEEAVKGKMKLVYPFHISEYAHSMGNAVGNLVDYQRAMESTNFFCGGAIWDWIDQAMYAYDAKSGERYMAFGGDFGDQPNDGQFVMNGIIFANLVPKPQYYEVKKVFQNVAIEAVDIQHGKVSVFNKQYFEKLDNLQGRWSLWQDGTCVRDGRFSVDGIAPRSKKELTLSAPLDSLNPGCEYFLKVELLQKQDMPWCKAGYVQCDEQLFVKAAQPEAWPATLQLLAPLRPARVNDSIVEISGTGFDVLFNHKQGTIHSLNYGEQVIIPEGCGPKLDAFRALVNNDNWFWNSWYENGLHNLRNHVKAQKVLQNPDGSVTINYTLEVQAPNGATIRDEGVSRGRFTITEKKDRPFGDNDFKFFANLLWTVYPDGSIELQSALSSNKPALTLPRLGYVLEMPKAFENLSYYGRGPVGNYPDRKTGQNIEVFKGKIANEINIWPKPQDTGNHEEVRWCAVTNAVGEGAIFIAPQSMSIQALPNSAMDMTLAPHTYQLPRRPNNYLHLDLGVTGLGGNSCGQGGPLERDRVKASNHRMALMIRPVNDNAATQAKAVFRSAKPLVMSRNADGLVSIEGDDNATVVYTLNGGKMKTYTGPFELTEGGSIVAWRTSRSELTYNAEFPKQEATPVRVVFCSSQEDNVADNVADHLVDGDEGTIWHTVYGVTVAQYPHWVDFDAGKVKPIKGFVYLPRQDSNNGNIRDYEIYLSNDAKTWGEPVHKGSFENNQKAKRVEFGKSLPARYLRFRALSSQNGQDFASGAEFQVLTE